MFRNQAALVGDRRAKALAESRETLPAAGFERAAHSWCDVESSAACRKRTKIGEKVGAAGRIRQEPLGPNCRRASAMASAKSREAQSVARFGRKPHSRLEREISEVCASEMYVSRRLRGSRGPRWPRMRNPGATAGLRRSNRDRDEPSRLPVLPHGSPDASARFGERVRNVRN